MCDYHGKKQLKRLQKIMQEKNEKIWMKHPHSLIIQKSQFFLNMHPPKKHEMNARK